MPRQKSKRSDRATPSTARMLADWRVLCDAIGERLAGTAAEQAAADHIEASWRTAGVDEVWQEPFPCTSLRGATVAVQAREGRRWQDVESRVLVGSPSTRNGTWVEGDIAWLELPEQGPRLAANSLRGRICVLFGALPTSVALHKKLVAANPLAVIHIDERLPHGWAKNDGVFPEWARRHGVPVTVTVPYLTAWDWRRRDVRRVRVRAKVTLRQAQSQNVVGLIRGREPELGEILVGAHHDSQANNVGADDNASGVVCLCELARLLQGSRPRRSVRLVSFGTEEQLSVGSAAYVRAHRRELQRIALVVNIDSVASPLGHHGMLRSGDEDCERYALRLLARNGVDVQCSSAVVPFADHFCFSIYDVPALTFMRSNTPGGRWQHHSLHDDLDNISPAVVADLLVGISALVRDAAGRRTLPFAQRSDPALMPRTREWARSLFGIRA